MQALFSLEYTELITLAAVITALLLLALGGLAVLGRAAQLTVLAAALLLATLTVRCCLHPRQVSCVGPCVVTCCVAAAPRPCAPSSPRTGRS